MKIIRPMDLSGTGVVESTALTENYVSWLQGGQGILGALAERDIPSDAVSTAADSSKTVFMTGTGDNYQLFLYDSSTDEVEDITFKLAGFASLLYGFEISRDGNYIVAATRISEASDDYIITLNTSTWQLRSFVCAHLKFAILPDSSGVVFPISRSGANIDYRLVSLASGATLWTKTITLSGVDYDDPAIYASNSSDKLIVEDSKYYAFSNPDNYFGLISFDFATEASIYKELTDVPNGRTLFSFFRASLGSDAIALSYWSPVDQKTRVTAWKSSDLTEIFSPVDVDGYPNDERSIAWSQDSSEFTVGSSLSPFIHRVASSTGAVTEPPSLNTGGGAAYVGAYVDTYIVVNVSGIDFPQFIDVTDNTIAEYIQPNFKLGDRVIFRDRVFEALTDNNDRPDVGAIADPPTWLDLGFINPLRMFDNKLDSRTTAPSPLVIEIETGRITNGLALFNLAASSVQVTYTDPVDGLVYDSGDIGLLDNSGVRTWYDFFFEPYSRRSDFARLDLPAYTDGTITITLTNNEGDAAVGEIVAGSIYRIGEAQFGSSAGILDFSRKEQDQFGRFDIVKRRFSKRAEYDAVIDPATGGNIQRTLAQYRAAPVVWIGDESKEETIVYGFFREFDILLDNPAFTAVTITVEGL
jgi:hypothetical protein